MMPSSIFAHGHWKVGEQKMSKSLGNIIDPIVVMDQLLKGQPYAADIYRYYLLREVPFGQDGSFSDEALLTRLSTELGNDLGNLVNRACSMIERYCGGVMPPLASGGLNSTVPQDQTMWEAAAGMPSAVDEAMGALAYSVALEAIMGVVARANRYIEETAPWKLAKEPSQKARLDAVLRLLAETIGMVGILLQPFMPSVAEEILRQLGCERRRYRFAEARLPRLTTGQRLADHPVLFPRLEVRA
jgi:methionyl-tRNA synthetase